MYMHDEVLAVEEIKRLSVNAKHHLSHVLRNGLMTIISCNARRDPGVEDAVLRLEGLIKEMDI